MQQASFMHEEASINPKLMMEAFYSKAINLGIKFLNEIPSGSRLVLNPQTNMEKKTTPIIFPNNTPLHSKRPDAISGLFLFDN